MPCWSQVIGYEQGDPAVTAILQQGYPRFVVHPLVRRLVTQLGLDSSRALPFPSARVAARARAFAGGEGRIVAYQHKVCVVEVPAEHAVRLYRFWQHGGEILSSRAAEALLADRWGEPGEAASRLKMAISALAGCQALDVWLFPSGMAAIFAALRVVLVRAPGRPVAQLGFPYVDTLELQHAFSAGVWFYADNGPDAVAALAARLDHALPAAVFCECPANPLMQLPDLTALARLLRPRGIPLVVDNTLDSFHRVALTGIADLVVTSATKFLSGSGDVMGGALIVMPDSPIATELRASVRDDWEDLVFPGDLIALAEQIDSFPTRMAQIDTTALALADHLVQHLAIAWVYRADREPHARALLGETPGFGGLFSLTLTGGEAAARRFYDRLACNKGPGLGTRFTLVCPYTQLAHFHSLAWAAEQGVPADLIRVSVGAEPIDDLISRFDDALSSG
jgi:cystathionine gamma-synthase